MQFSTWQQSFFLTLTVLGVFLWTQFGLQTLDLQLLALLVLGFFLTKKYSKGKTWRILPTIASIEMVFLTGALLLLVATTGNLQSPIFAVTYIHLFLLVFTTQPIAAIITSCAIALFHYLSAGTITAPELNTLATIPLGLIFFLFAREQYHELLLEKEHAAQNLQTAQRAQQDERTLETVLTSFLIPKLHQLTQRIAESDSQLSQDIATKLQEIVNEAESLIRSKS